MQIGLGLSLSARRGAGGRVPLITAGAISGLGTFSRNHSPSTAKLAGLQSDGVTWGEYAAGTAARVGSLQRLAWGASRINSTTAMRCEGATVGTMGSGGAVPAGWGTFTSPTGLTRSVLGTGTVNGIQYVDYYVTGTPSSTGEISLYLGPSVTASPGQAWAQSAFVAIVGGSLSNIGSVTLRALQTLTAGYVRETAVNILGSLTGTLQRLSNVTSAAGTGIDAILPTLSFYAASAGVAVDFVVRVGWPQLEQAGSVSPPLLAPVGSPQTARTLGDLITFNLASLGVADNGACAVVIEALAYQANIGGANQRLFTLSDGSNSNRFTATINGSSQGVAFRTNAGATSNSPAAGTVPSASLFKLAVGIDGTGRVAVTVNGGTVQQAVGGVTSGLNLLSVGADAGATAQLIGEIANLNVYPGAPTDAFLQSLAA